MISYFRIQKSRHVNSKKKPFIMTGKLENEELFTHRCYHGQSFYRPQREG